LEVRYSAQALHDLHEVWRYIAHDRPAVADKVASSAGLSMERVTSAAFTCRGADHAEPQFDDQP
jgi:plasmid stabilization system protein ParE